MENYFYIVIEVQIDASGNKGVIPITYEDYDQALSKLYTVLAAAAVNDLPYHAGFIMRSDGMMLDHHAFDRR